MLFENVLNCVLARCNRRVKIEKHVGSARVFAMLFQRNSSFASTKLIIVAMEACVSFILR